MSETLLDVQGLSKSFFGVPALSNVSLQVEQGKVLGLLGENGAGKTTLMNILGGVIQADSGSMSLAGKPYTPRTPADAKAAGIAFIHQELNLFTNLSIAENMFVDAFPRLKPLPFIDRRRMRERTRDILKLIDVDLSPDTPIEKLSPGERQLVEIARAAGQEARLIIFDEPTTSLTARETDHLFKLIGRLRQSGKALIYISHILNDVIKLADEVAVLRDGELVASGEVQDFPVNRMISAMVGRTIEQLYPPRTGQPTSDVALRVEALSQRGIIENISFDLHRGEILGIFGLMGSGRTEMARILFGLDEFERGQIMINGVRYDKTSPRAAIQQQIAFVTENRREEGLLMDIPISENLGLVALPGFAGAFGQFLDQRRLVSSAREVAGSVKLKAGGALERQAVKSLSGGNQQKVVIARWLALKPRILIMDEPTRGIDVGAKAEVHALMSRLAREGVAIIMISSELPEIMGMSDRILVMHEGHLVGEVTRAEATPERLMTLMTAT